MKNHVTALLFLLHIILMPCLIHAQGGTWTWVHGPAGTNVAPVFGTKGVPGVNNNPPALYEAATWADKQGYFWIYGGLDSSGNEHSDLWKYDPNADTWTWINGQGLTDNIPVYGTMGVPSVSGNPGARAWGVTTWTDAHNNLWLFGGTLQAGAYGDLWKYDITADEWTWMSGSNIIGSAGVYGTQGIAASGNMPGSRWECTSSWVDDAGNLWLFGGLLQAGGVMNDLWTYNISTNLWTWINGSQTIGSPGSYGAMGVAAGTNQPPSRMSYTNWKDMAGNFYIFGGATSNEDTYSDVWKYDPVHNLWTWVAGENYTGTTGRYGSYCTTNGATGPASRFENRTAQITGCSGSAAFSFGGFNNNNAATLNDLWMFDMQHDQWTWVSGTNTLNDAGNYGAKGVPAAGNRPPSRAGQSMWMQNNGTLWLFGGWGPLGGSLGSAYLSDMWKFTPDLSCVTIPLTGGINAVLQQNLICNGDSALLTITGASGIHISPSGSVHLIDTAHAWLVPGTTTTYLITGNSLCRNNDTAYITLNVTLPGVLNYFLSDTQLCAGTQARLNLLGQNATTITPLTGVVMLDSLHYLFQPVVTTTYTLNGASAVCGGSNSAQFTIHVTPHNPVNITLSDTVNCAGTYDTVTVSGLSDITITNAFHYQVDSTHIIIGDNYYYNGPVIINGTTSCGGLYTDTVNMVTVYPGQINYTLSNTDICRHDTALLTLYGVNNAYIYPDIALNWLDPEHVQLFPSATTSYTVYGGNHCSGSDSANFTVTVIQPGTVTYSYQSNNSCQSEEGFVYLYIYGLYNVQVAPAPFSLNQVDTDETEAGFYITGPTTVTVTGQSICGGNDTTARIQISTGINITVNVAEDNCAGDSSGAAQVTANGGGGIYYYLWSNGGYSAGISGLTPGTYTVTVTDAYLCSATGSVSVGPAMVVLTNTDSATCGLSNGAAQISVSGGTKPYTYAWKPAVSYSAAATGLNAGAYQVTITDSAGCEYLDTFSVNSNCDNRLVIPNAFTPNGDGKNDVFKPLFIDAPDRYSMHIYNRWGQLVFETTEATTGWDGKFKGAPQPTGTFIYYIQYTYTGQKTQGLRGALELVR